MSDSSLKVRAVLILPLLFAALANGCRRSPAPASPVETFPSPSGPAGLHYEDQAPVAWRKTPVDSAHFEYSVDLEQKYSGRASARIDGKSAAIDRVASISQLFAARPLVGRRVRVTAMLRQRNVQDWAHMWVAVRGVGGSGLAADRVPLDRIQGDLDWRQVEAEVEVPMAADTFSLGFVLAGPGTFWVDDVQILDAKGGAISSPLRNSSFEEGVPSKP